MGAQQHEPHVIFKDCFPKRGSGARAPGPMNEPRITGSIQQSGAFANTDLKKVVRFLQHEAEGTVSATKNTRLLSRGKSTVLSTLGDVTPRTVLG